MLNKIVNAVWSLFNGSKSVWYHPAFLAAYFGYMHFYVDVWKPWLRKHLVRCLIFQTANGHQMVMFVYTEENWKAKFEGLPVLLQKYANNVPLGTFKKNPFPKSKFIQVQPTTHAHTYKKNWEYKKCKKLFVRSIPFREATLRTAAAKSLKGHFSRCWKKLEHNAGTQVKEWVRDSCIEWNYASRATFFLARRLRRSSRVLAVRRHPVNAQFLMGTSWRLCQVLQCWKSLIHGGWVCLWLASC